MRFFAVTRDAGLALERFNESIRKLDESNSSQLIRKIENCPYDVYLIGTNSYLDDQPMVDPLHSEILSELHHVWVSMMHKDKRKNTRLLEPTEIIKIINKYGEKISPIPESSATLLFRFSKSPFENSFFRFVNAADPDGFTQIEMHAICNLWQINEGRIPMHACGIIHHGGLYLFGGPSGIGKSTVAKFSHEMGDEILDQDQVMIYQRSDGSYAANAWGYSLESSDVPIKAFFRLIQAKTNRLTSLSQVHTARFMMEQSFVLAGKMQPENAIVEVFTRIADLARSVPGYQLLFRRSPEFWKLIEAEFGLERA